MCKSISAIKIASASKQHSVHFVHIHSIRSARHTWFGLQNFDMGKRSLGMAEGHRWIGTGAGSGYSCAVEGATHYSPYFLTNKVRIND